jgi:hypothetical protein
VFAILRTTLGTPRQTWLTVLWVLVSVCWTRQTVVVDAEQLVQSALIAERQQRPVPGEATAARFVPIDASESYTVVGDFRVAVASGSVASATPLALASAYMATPFGARLSLSMEAVAAFRAMHAGALQDQIVRRDHDNQLCLEMRVPYGELRGVEIVLDAETHKVLRQVLSFPRIGRVEIERLSQSVPAFVPSRRPGVLLANYKLPPREALEKAELQALLVLGQSGLDMRSQFRVSRSPAGVRVESGLLAADQQSKLAAKLAAIELVRIDFRGGSMSYQTPPELRPVRTGLREWLDRRFRDPATRESFCPRLFQTLDTVHHRVALLADLAQRYPDSQTPLSSSARGMLQQLVDLHYRRLRGEINDARVWVSPLSGAVHVISDTSETPPMLLSRAVPLLGRVTAFEQLVNTTMRQRDLLPADQERINAEFADLWQTLYGPLPTRH